MELHRLVFFSEMRQRKLGVLLPSRVAEHLAPQKTFALFWLQAEVLSQKLRLLAPMVQMEQKPGLEMKVFLAPLVFF